MNIKHSADNPSEQPAATGAATAENGQPSRLAYVSPAWDERDEAEYQAYATRLLRAVQVVTEPQKQWRPE